MALPLLAAALDAPPFAEVVIIASLLTPKLKVDIISCYLVMLAADHVLQRFLTQTVRFFAFALGLLLQLDFWHLFVLLFPPIVELESVVLPQHIFVRDCSCCGGGIASLDLLRIFGQVEQLLAWLLQRSKQLNAAAQLGPQALSATAGALARLLSAQQQHSHRRPGHLNPVRQAQAPHGQQAQQSSDHQKQEMLQEIASAAVAQRHRLSPQGFWTLLLALSTLEQSDLSAQEGNIHLGEDGSYLAGFLAREVERAASEARDGGSSGASAATLLQAVLVKYQQFLGAAHVALLCHHLADLWQTGWAGSGEDSCEGIGVSDLSYDLQAMDDLDHGQWGAMGACG
eukprot:gene6963-7178_t